MQVITVDKDNGKRVFSRKEVATICDVSTQTISLWEKAGDIPVSVRDDNGYRSRTARATQSPVSKTKTKTKTKKEINSFLGRLYSLSFFCPKF